MSYIYKQKISLVDLLARPKPVKIVLMAEQEEYLAGIYIRLLQEENFEVIIVSDPSSLHTAIRHRSPHIMIINTEILPKIGKAAQLRIINKNFPHMPIITLGYNASAGDLQELMAAGVMSHIDRRLTRPQDLIVIVKSLLNQ